MQSYKDTNDQCQAGSTAFSLEKYFLYVGLSGFFPAQLTLQALKTIIEHHLSTFNYQNSILYNAGKMPADTRVIPPLDINDLFALMIRKKGGYCFQHLELLFAVLSAAGFNVNRRLAKVIMQPCAQLDSADMPDLPKTHESLVVHLDGKHYLVDVGMANQSIRGPLELKEGAQTIDDDQYRLIKTGELWRLDTKTVRDNEWLCLYQFFNTPVQHNEIEKAHINLYLTEKSIPIRDDKLLIGQTTLEKRKYLMWLCTGAGFGIFRSIKKNSDDAPKTRKFSSYEEVEAFAKKKFGTH